VKAVVLLKHLIALSAGDGQPKGKYLTVEMEDKELITKLHIGQVLILSYSEAIAVSLEKAAAPAKK
jgi:hypothetical protein